MQAAPFGVACCTSASEHLDGAQTLRKAVRVDPDINRVTVYRTLGLLERQGLVDELDLLHDKGAATFASAVRNAATCT